MRRRRLVGAAAAMALGLAVVATGCSSEGEGDGAAPATTVTGSTTPPVGAAADGSTGQLLADLALAPSDAHDDERLVPALDGDEVGPGSGLHHCGNRLRTDEARVARHQADLLVGGRPLVTGEAVRYQPGQAEAALAELRSVVEACPEGVFHADGSGGAPVSTTSEPIPEERLAGVAEDHVALLLTEEVEGGDGADARQVLVVQRRGDVLVVTSGYGDEARILEVAAAAGSRLAAADADALGA